MIPSRHIPNLVTMSRLVLAIGAFWFMGEVVDADPSDSERIRSASFWAFWLFLIAAVSDFLDGWLARRNGWVTAFGRVADPVVDKVLTLVGWYVLGRGCSEVFPGHWRGLGQSRFKRGEVV